MVRKLNATKHLRRIYPSIIEDVSENEVKSTFWDVSSFMNIMLGDASDGYSQALPHASPNIPLYHEVDRPLDNCQANQNPTVMTRS